VISKPAELGTKRKEHAGRVPNREGEAEAISIIRFRFPKTIDPVGRMSRFGVRHSFVRSLRMQRETRSWNRRLACQSRNDKAEAIRQRTLAF